MSDINPFSPAGDALRQPDAGAPGDCAFYTLGAATVGPGAGGAVVAGSAQPVFVPVALEDPATGRALDPTARGVRLAFSRGAAPGDSDWSEAGWVTREADRTRFATAGVIALEPGAYFIFVRTEDGFIGRAPNVLTVL